MTDYRKINRQKLVEYIRGGCVFTQRLGFELEHIVLHQDGSPVTYSEENGIRAVLNGLVPFYEHEHRENGELIGLSREGEAISIEPAGQIEVSAGPFDSVFDVERAYLDFRNRLDPLLEQYNLVTPMLGYNPASKAADLELVPKFRYDSMTKFLGAQSPYAICMMRGSASVQVSIDFESEADAMRKLRVAQAIAPFLALMCDNSPIFEAAEREGNMARTRVWSNMKPDRVGVIPGSMKMGYTFTDYADYILSRQAVLLPDEQEPSGFRFVGEETFDEAYANREMTEAELEHALSMVWPDVRIKRYLEIRPADAMPIEYCLAYVVLIRTLFYSKRNLEVLESLLSNVDEGHIAQAKQALMERGYGAEVYGRPCEFWTDLLMVLASGSLQPGEWAYLEPLASMVKYRFTLAEIWPRLMEKRNTMPAGSVDAPIIGVVPRYDFEWTGLAVSDGYLSGLLETGAVPVVLPLTNDPNHIKHIVNTCDGFLIPGGQDINPDRYGARREPHTHRSATSRDAMEQALILAAVEADKPILGICRGMQSLNVALGGTLNQDIQRMGALPAEGHVQRRPFDMPAHMVDIVEGTKLAQIVGAPRLGVNTIHHQAVAQLGKGLVVSAISPEDGVIEGIELPDARFVVGVQWHPEHMWRTRPHSKRIFSAFVEACRK